MMVIDQIRLFVVCVVVAFFYFVLLCVSGLALSRVLRAAARDAYSSPRRRLLALDDGVARRSPNRVMRVLGACRPWTTQKALLAMVSLSAALRVAWACVAVLSWDAVRGVIGISANDVLRVLFYGIDVVEAAVAFTLYTIVARFWADLAYAARQGTGATRPIGGGDEYRPRGTPPWIWKVTRGMQRSSIVIAFAAAACGTLLLATAWDFQASYVNTWTGFIEAGVYLLAAIVTVAAAYYAVVELRLVPIELPTRRRRVCRIAAVTGSVATCLFLRALVLIWVSGRPVTIVTNWDMAGILAYWGLLDALPMAIILAYNRMVPLSTTVASGGGGQMGSFRRGRPAPEEEPLIAGTGTGSRNPFDDGNPFAVSRPEVHL